MNGEPKVAALSGAPAPGAWLDMLRVAVAAKGVSEVARLVGVSHTAVSLALVGKYPAKTTRLAAKVLQKLGRIACPHLGCEITGVECAAYRNRAMPQSDPTKLKHWVACRRCPIGAALSHAGATDAQ